MKMDEAEFWALIDRTREESQGDKDMHLELLLDAVAALPEQEILDYGRHFYHYYGRAYRRDLWAAAYIINGGCSDDGFSDFRAWLISRGLSVYEQALNDPESLAGIVDCLEFVEFEGFQYIPWQAWERKTGSLDLPDGVRKPEHLTGEEWDENSLEHKFPRLWAKYEPCWAKKWGIDE